MRIHTHNHNGIELDSGWELELAKWLDQQGIEWTRPTEPIKWFDSSGNPHSYFPDFYLPLLELYLDPKNPYLVETSQEKYNAVRSHVDVIWGDPQSIIHHVISKLAP